MKDIYLSFFLLRPMQSKSLLKRYKSLLTTYNFLNKKWFVYILNVKDGSYYTGISNNVFNRLYAHNIGKGSKYVRSKLPFGVAYLEMVKDRSEALKLESYIKKMKKIDKTKYIENKCGKYIIKCECNNIIKTLEPIPLEDFYCPSCGYIINLR